MSGEMATVVRGAMLGFAIAAPVGAIGVLCIRRTLAEGRLMGLASGLGAAAADGVYGLIAALASTFALTLTNPMTILSFMAAFAGIGLALSKAPFAPLLLIAGVVAGSATWWLLLSAVVDRLRSRFDARGMRWVNRFSGALIAGFGVVTFAGPWMSRT